MRNQPKGMLVPILVTLRASLRLAPTVSGEGIANIFGNLTWMVQLVKLSHKQSMYSIANSTTIVSFMIGDRSVASQRKIGKSTGQ